MDNNKKILQHIINGCIIEILNHKCDYVGIQYAKANGHYYIGDELYVIYEGGGTGKSIKEFKLVLFGLDKLTKEIEFGDEKFVPALRTQLHMNSFSYPLVADNIQLLENRITTNTISNSDMQYLISLHFDVFKLIPLNIGVDVVSINEGKIIKY